MFRALSRSVVLRLVRLVLNLVLIAALGRHLGVQNMGLLLSAQALVTVLLCVAELGFACVTVRERVQHATLESEILGATFSAWLIVGFGLFAALVGVGFWLESQRRATQVWTAQLVGFLCGAIVLGLGVFNGASVVFFHYPT